MVSKKYPIFFFFYQITHSIGFQIDQLPPKLISLPTQYNVILLENFTKPTNRFKIIHSINYHLKKNNNNNNKYFQNKKSRKIVTIRKKDEIQDKDFAKVRKKERNLKG